MSLLASLFPLLAAGAYQPPTLPPMPSAGGLLARFLVFLIASLALLAGAVWYARRQSATPTGTQTTVTPRVVSSVPLGPHGALHLVQVEQTGFVIAADATGLKTLHQVTGGFDTLVDEELGQPPDNDLSPRRLP